MVMIIRAMGLVTVIIILNTWASQSPRGLESEGNEILIKMRRRRIEDWIGKIVGQKWWYWCWWMQWIRYYGNDDEEGTKVVMMMRTPRGHRGRGCRECTKDSRATLTSSLMESPSSSLPSPSTSSSTSYGLQLFKAHTINVYNMMKKESLEPDQLFQD